ncbi:two-component system, response regulator YesN [Evansella caseinilytica]|uniref:Two-component system, response regulator YesN n=1 Tax=Evansella caseinilytica TaxID=1503961 RepID=A0A1H3FY49_9BACI|nr:response regulator [Evansella caseinilytica]SDX95860.1 two-component system, response regulator YesN [Evansella caseinilytica]
MVKLLIVDDEEIERRSMELILAKAFPDLAIREAKNGKVAVELARSFKPDLILMDIKMPGMNGLDAVEQIKKDGSTAKFIMVTAYDTFDYAKQAIKLGAKDYILKPSKVSEMITTVGHVIEQINAEKAAHAEQRKQKLHFQKSKRVIETDMVTQLLFDHVHDVHIDMLMDMLDIKSIGQMFVLVVLLPEGLENQYPAIVDRVKQEGNVWVGALYGRQFPVIVFRDEAKTYRSQAGAIIRNSLKAMERNMEQGWFVGIGDVYDSIDDIKKSYHQAVIALMDTARPMKYRFYADVPVGDNQCDRQLDKYRTKAFFDQVRLGEWDKITQKLTMLIQCYEKEAAPLQKAQQRILEMVWMIARILDEMNVQMEWKHIELHSRTYRQFVEEITLFLGRVKAKYIAYYHDLEVDSMQQVKQYIIAHSNEDISLDLLADQVGLSPIYISKMFKEKLGINYIDFLTECRIEKAKALLADPEKSIKEITFDSGYHDPNYFSKVFKRLTGVSPKAYREKILGTQHASH